MSITFHRHPDLTQQDSDISDNLAREYFHNAQDPDQIGGNEWDFESTKMFPYSWTVIKKNAEQIGYAFILPAKKHIMKDFLCNKITEQELSDRIKKEVTMDDFDAIYLCASFIRPEYENKGYVFRAVLNSVNNMICNRKDVALFAWPFSDKGSSVITKAKNLCEKKGIEFYIKN